MTTDQAIEDLQIRLAHLESGLQQVSDEVARQQQLIERLQLRNQQLQERLGELQSDGGADAATRVEIPPHY